MNLTTIAVTMTLVFSSNIKSNIILNIEMVLIGTVAAYNTLTITVNLFRKIFLNPCVRIKDFETT